MAQVTHVLSPSERIDPYLDSLFREWESIPELAREWVAWEEPDRLDFTYEWSIREDYLAQLQGWVTQGLLTPAQQARYDNLLGLVARHRPLLATLLREEAPAPPPD